MSSCLLGVHEWLSLDDSTKVSAFGTRTGLFSSGADVNTVDHDAGASGAASGENAQCPSSPPWLEELRVGSLIDVCDLRGVWYQVRRWGPNFADHLEDTVCVLRFQMIVVHVANE